MFRLYPIYFISLILVLVASFLGQWIAGDGGEALQRFLFVNTDPLSRVVSIITNFSMLVGILNFISPNWGLNPSGYGINYFSVIPVSWSLMPELVFYLIAPLLVRMRTGNLVVVGFISYIIQFPILSAGLGNIPWVYMSPASSLIYFITGILAYRMHKRIDSIPAYLPYLVLTIVVIFTIEYQYLLGSYYDYDLLYPVVIAASLPFLFRASTQFSYLGLLSYPVFLLHWTTFYYLRHFINPYWIGLSTLIVAIIISIAILKLVRPIDKWRAKRAKIHSS